MVKRPGLGKRKRVSTPTPQPETREVEEPEPQPDELPETQSTDIPDLASQAADDDDMVEGTQEAQSQGRFKKKRLVRMTDAQEDEMAQWLQNHPEMYNKAKKEYRDTERKEAAWEAQARVMGMDAVDLKVWFKGMRTRFGKLTSRKSGDGAKEHTDRDAWILRSFSFLGDHIARVPSRQSCNLKPASATAPSATVSTASTTSASTSGPAAAAAASTSAGSQPSAELDPTDEPVESGSLGEPRVCSTPPPGVSLSSSSAPRRITRRSNSTESELLDQMCQQSENSAQISDRLERLLTSMEAQNNERTAWAAWMSAGMVNIHEDLWPGFQMRSMDLLNQTIKESKILKQRDEHRQELDKQQQMDDRQRQLDDRQKQLDMQQQQLRLQQQKQMQQQQQQQQQLLYQPAPQQYTITQLPAASASAQTPSSSTLPSTTDTQGQTTVVFQAPTAPVGQAQPAAGSSTSSATKVVITDTEGRTIGLSDLNLSDLNASFAGIPSVPATPMTPMTLINQDDSQNQ